MSSLKREIRREIRRDVLNVTQDLTQQFELYINEQVQRHQKELGRRFEDMLEAARNKSERAIYDLNNQYEGTVTELKKVVHLQKADIEEALKFVRSKRVIKKKTEKGVIPSLVHEKFSELVGILDSTNRSTKNVMLVGPAGGGKTHICSSVAEHLNLDFYPMSVGSQTTKSDLVGFIAANGDYKTTPVRQAFENGGLLLLDEFDATHAGVVTILNALLSNNEVGFPDSKVTKHKNFVCIVACNTYGTGANSKYIGRNKLDAATLDRFITLTMDYDNVLEDSLVGYQSLAYIMKVMRRNIDTKKLDFVVSPRASMNIADLYESNFTLKRALEICVFKGAPHSVIQKLLDGIDEQQMQELEEQMKQEKEEKDKQDERLDDSGTGDSDDSDSDDSDNDSSEQSDDSTPDRSGEEKESGKKPSKTEKEKSLSEEFQQIKKDYGATGETGMAVGVMQSSPDGEIYNEQVGQGLQI